MSANTDIEWCHHTFNPWWICAKISPECTHCYAEAFARRLGYAWGPTAPRRFFGDAHWAAPLKWNRDAERAGKRRTVFCASMADVFEDRRDLDVHRTRLWALIERTPHLDWLLLSKRPEHMTTFTPRSWAVRWPANVWAGTTCGHPDSLPRVRALREVPAVVRFVSVEPLLAPFELPLDGIAWVIVGGESGAGARPMDEAWVRALRDRCTAAGVAFFYKQRIERGRKVSLPLLDGMQWNELPASEARP